MFSVTISEKGGQQSQYDFSKGQITIGRMKGNDIVLPKGNVSKQHTRIFLREDSFYIVDLKSTNGTYVNGRKVAAEQPVAETDKIYIGDFILQLKRQTAQQPGGGPPTPPQPPQPGNTGGGMGGSSSGQQSGGGGGRRFPTVMDGASDGGNQPGAITPPPGQAPNPGRATSPQPAGPSPSTPSSPGGDFSMGPGSSSGAGQSPGVAGQDNTPVPGGGQDLRKTYGDSKPPVEMMPELEPVESDSGVGSSPGAISPPASAPSAPTPTPAPVSSTPAPSVPVPSGSSPALSPSTPGAPSPGVSSGGSPSAIPSLTPEPASPGGGQQPGVQQGGSLGTPSLANQAPLDSEFDESFHRAQQDVARVFFESTSVGELPIDYPIDDETVENRVLNAVTAAVGAVKPSVDSETLIDAITKEAIGLGPLEDYLDDDSIESIYINAYDRIVLRREGKLVVASRAYSHPEMLDLAARRLLGPHETPPITDEVRFSDGTRVHILMPPLSVDGPVLTVRKPNRYFPTVDELASKGAMSTGMAEFLKHAVEAGRSIIIAGPTSSGKTTLLSALTASVPPSSRVIALEQHSHLALNQPNFIRLEASPASGFDMRFLLHNAVAMHPDRILLDECRGAEAYDWVTAAASGTEGSMVTVHGTSAVDALSRFESMCLLAANDISPRGLREQVARSVDLVVILNSTADGGFRVQQIAEVQGVDLDAFRLNDIFYFRVEGTAGEFHPTGYIPLFYEDLRHAGLDVDLGIFRE